MPKKGKAKGKGTSSVVCEPVMFVFKAKLMTEAQKWGLANHQNMLLTESDKKYKGLLLMLRSNDHLIVARGIARAKGYFRKYIQGVLNVMLTARAISLLSSDNDLDLGQIEPHLKALFAKVNCADSAEGVMECAREVAGYAARLKLNLLHEKLHAAVVSEFVRSVDYEAKEGYSDCFNNFLSSLEPKQLGHFISSLLEACRSAERNDSDYDDMNWEVAANALAKGPARVALREAMYSHLINHRLQKLGSLQVSTANDADESPSSRLIITTHDVLAGLRLITDYLKEEDKELSDILTGRLVASELFEPESLGAEVGGDNVEHVEMAWGLLQGLERHKADNPVVTVSFQSAAGTIAALKGPSTVVFDGHGGRDYATFGMMRREAVEFEEELAKLLQADAARNIQHIVLQACRAGVLVPAGEPLVYLKKNKPAQKARALVVDSEASCQLSLASSQSPSLAGVFLKVIRVISPKIALTFSENPVNPSNVCLDGNVGAVSCDDPNEREWWYEAPRPTVDESAEPLLPLPCREMLKSITLVHDSEHPKVAKSITGARYVLTQGFFSPKKPKVEATAEPILADNDSMVAEL